MTRQLVVLFPYFAPEKWRNGAITWESHFLVPGVPTSSTVYFYPFNCSLIFPESIMDRDFHHPFVPYEIQRQFMNNLYGCLEDGKVAVFESPTGM